MGFNVKNFIDQIERALNFTPEDQQFIDGTLDSKEVNKNSIFIKKRIEEEKAKNGLTDQQIQDALCEYGVDAGVVREIFDIKLEQASNKDVKKTNSAAVKTVSGQIKSGAATYCMDVQNGKIVVADKIDLDTMLSDLKTRTIDSKNASPEDKAAYQKCYDEVKSLVDVFKQVIANPNVQLCALYGNLWLRITGTIKIDDSINAKRHNV